MGGEDTTFTPEQKRVLEAWGWEKNYDLVGEVYVKRSYHSDKFPTDSWIVLNPDGQAHAVKTDNISDALGTY
jgi:hypothetical protein